MPARGAGDNALPLKVEVHQPREAQIAARVAVLVEGGGDLGSDEARKSAVSAVTRWVVSTTKTSI